MDFLEKLNFLMEKNKLNKNTLSKACSIPYTTIDGWYKKGYEGLKLPTLRKLSNFFGTTLDYWADDQILEPPNLENNSNESTLLKGDDPFVSELVDVYKTLNDENRKYLQGYVHRLLEEQTLKK